MVHYLLTIHKLKENRGYARVTDIAKELNLTKGSVSTAINNLKKKDWIIEDEKENKFVILTKTGHQLVHKILSSRTLLYYFLKDFVGVTEEIAFKDSCAMEHLISSETYEKFFNFMKQLACTCDSKQSSDERFKIQSTLDLCQYAEAEDFIKIQKGDRFI